jgi:hypothetical protein
MAKFAHKYKRAPRQAPKLPVGFFRVRRGQKPNPPKLSFKEKSEKWYVYYRKKEFSTGYGLHEQNAAKDEYEKFCAAVKIGQEAKRAPGEITFADMISSQLTFLKVNANTGDDIAKLAKFRTQSVWWLRFFGRKKLIQYRKNDSKKFQTWYVKERSAFYLAHPESRRSAANGAVVALRGLLRFCKDFAQGEETAWYPDIHIPSGEEIPAGDFFRRSQQAAALLACRGWVMDRKTGEWKTKSYVDENGVVRTTRRILSRRVIENRKGKSRALRLGARTGAREQDLMSAVWGEADNTSYVEVDDDGVGTFHRRGKKERDTKKSRPSSPVPDRLKCLLRIWKKEDGQGRRLTELDRATGAKRKKHRYLIRKANGRPYQCLSFANIVRDAGLPPTYTEHALRRTAVEEAHLQRWSLATATQMIGMTAEVLLGFYTDWDERASKIGTQAMREANSALGAKLLRDSDYTPPQPGDRVRTRQRTIDRLSASRNTFHASP